MRPAGSPGRRSLGLTGAMNRAPTKQYRNVTYRIFMKVYALSLGCPKNLVDTEKFLADLVSEKWEVVAEPDNADVLFLNTCAFLSEAVVESKKFLRDLISVKKRFPKKKIYLAGCLASREGKALLSEFPEVDRLIMPGEMAPLSNRFLCTPGHYAYLKVSDGCDNHCRYCLIPSLRGPFKSYPMERLVAEAHTLVAGGVRELNVCAQDTTGYGADLYGKPVLDKLLMEICRIKGLRWVRLLYTYPTGYNRKLIEALQEEKICPYLDIPLQHASDRILSAMNRRGSQKEYRKLIAGLRRVIPDLTLRTTFIVGYPGETEDDFQILFDFIREMEFEKMGLFAYSPETGTPAADLPQVPQSLKEERLEKLWQVQNGISRRKMKILIGREIEAVSEDINPEDKKKSIGRTIFDAPEVDGSIFLDRLFPAGTFVRVKITGADDYDLYGKVIKVL